ncbi:glucose-6-phosphate dehydrogenase assembly protein OpcA [Sporichthya sp.]|uniref:glucose-6-phosphate dehydrogenase assembly protein OpcA n=1 Tax=Sporichthya sp. TaxID=65475 RepID=UPI0017D2A8CB|nr:glucose-6-phosphate dehydrogenase assembly protein OpcA [Sporichthya sp.]MBA3744626.1 glucose-6-phosphate dehydrogenase assembly protein OpcA [Sporichthya sp.]
MSELLKDTTAAGINKALIAARRAGGSQATGQVLTLVVVTEDDEHAEAVEAAVITAAEHPSRILVARCRSTADTARLDSEIFGSGERGPGELVILDLCGELAAHADSVVLPLLVPDAPVVTYWPGQAPADPSADPIGALSQRRITDLATAADPVAGLTHRAASYAEGDTDLSWTRVTPWRSQLAAALDQPHDPIVRGSVAGEADSPSTELLARWLQLRLGIEVERGTSGGPGLTEVRLVTEGGEIALVRTDGRLATLSAPGWPERPIALPRRPLSELIAEELRRLDPDEIYADCLAACATPDPGGTSL